MGLIEILAANPLAFFMLVIPLLYSVIMHEVAHGAVALAFGDTTAKRMGRLTLNPLSHLDPIGSLMLFLVGFGWARPVPVDFGRLSHTRAGIICVALAGVVTNMLLAIAAIYLLHLPAIKANPAGTMLLKVLAQINIILAAFNLIPIPPLDGSKVLMGFLPRNQWNALARLEPYGFGVLILLFFTGMLRPVIGFMENLIYGLLRSLPF